MDPLEAVQDYQFYSSVLSADSSSVDTADPSPTQQTVSDIVSQVESAVNTISTGTLSTKFSKFQTFIPAMGFFAIMNNFRTSALPAPPASNASEAVPDSTLRRLISSFASAINQQSAEADVSNQRIGAFLSYLMSPYAILCICMAILLNRTVVFATTRTIAPLPFSYRLLLRSVAIYFLASRTIPLISAAGCASPIVMDYLPAFFQPHGDCPRPPVLWDLYWGICISHFIETFSSVIQGQTPHSDTGMTLFEYSMAFQEVQSSEVLHFEVTVVAITSALSLISLHTLGIFNSFNYRLIPSSIFGASFLSYFAWSVFNGNLLYFPTVCIIGYLPNLIISCAIIVCFAVYLLSALMAGGTDNLATSWARANISLKDDFYGCLFKIGVLALTVTSQATFDQETTIVKQPSCTWIENEVDFEFKKPTAKPAEPTELAPPLLNVQSENLPPYMQSYARQSPYGKESPLPPELTKNQAHPKADRSYKVTTFSRFHMLAKILQALVLIMAQFLFNVCWNLGLKHVWRPKTEPDEHNSNEETEPLQNQEAANFEVCNGDDVENYQKLLWGDLLSEKDGSEDYVPEDDAYSTDEEGLEYESDFENEGTRSASDYVSHVARQRGRVSQEPTTKSTLQELYDLIIPTESSLLSLLAPKIPKDVETKRILISHLEDAEQGHPVTRSRYSKRTWDESQALLRLIEERRRKFVADDEVRETLCVVCQTAHRQIILWPCRCLSLCDECRLALVTQDFKGCVCCRREVTSFSKIYVP